MLSYYTQRETYKAMGVPQARNAIHMGEELMIFYKYSTKRLHNVDACIDDMTDGERSTTESKERRITRWMARHDEYSMMSSSLTKQCSIRFNIPLLIVNNGMKQV